MAEERQIKAQQNVLMQWYHVTENSIEEIKRSIKSLNNGTSKEIRLEPLGKKFLLNHLENIQHETVQKIIWLRKEIIRKFLLAAKIGDLDRVKAYIDEKVVDIDITDNGGYTALMSAAFFNQPKVVKYLLGAGADANLTNNIRATALDIVKDRQDDPYKEVKKYLNDHKPSQIRDRRWRRACSSPSLSDLHGLTFPFASSVNPDEKSVDEDSLPSDEEIDNPGCVGSSISDYPAP